MHSECKLFVIIVNYNYSRFILDQVDKFQDVKRQVDGFIIVDDQSTVGENELNQLKKIFTDNIITTTSRKSSSNAVNQMLAIKSALDHFLLNENDYLWVIDGDDIPLVKEMKVIKEKIECCDQNLVVFGRLENKILVNATHNHRFWVTNAPTSSLIARVSNVRKVLKTVRSPKFFDDVWYDIRLSIMTPHTQTLIADLPIFDKIIHANNDSKRYKNSLIARFKRVTISILFYFYNISIRER